MNSVKEMLRAVKTLIAKPENWTQNTAARDKRGMAIYIEAPEACSFCLSGALDRVTYDNRAPNSTTHFELLNLRRKSSDLLSTTLMSTKFVNHYIRYNDTVSHREVIELLDRAIQKAEALDV